MTITPFLALSLRGKKDALRARQRARRVASLLQFEPHEQVCIAAGAFVIACQALSHFRKARLCFRIENHQLQIFAAEASVQLEENAASASHRLAGLFPASDAKSLYRLTKPLPTREGIADEPDLAWLVTGIEAAAPGTVFDEVVKQNQEILALLHELRLYHGAEQGSQEKSANPHAA